MANIVSVKARRRRHARRASSPSRRARSVAASLVAAMLLAGGVAVKDAVGDELTLRFDINPMITGSRPWDGTGINSAQLDGGQSKDTLAGMLGLGASSLAQAGLEQLNQRMAPPDPVLCFMVGGQSEPDCRNGCRARDTLELSCPVPAAVTRQPWLGIVLYDSDEGNVAGGLTADLIGFGVVLDEPTLAALRSGDQRALAVARNAEQSLTRALGSQRYRSLLFSSGGGRVDAAKLAHSKCENGCRMGDSTVFINITVDGW